MLLDARGRQIYQLTAFKPQSELSQKQIVKFTAKRALIHCIMHPPARFVEFLLTHDTITSELMFSAWLLMIKPLEPEICDGSSPPHQIWPLHFISAAVASTSTCRLKFVKLWLTRLGFSIRNCQSDVLSPASLVCLLVSV